MNYLFLKRVKGGVCGFVLVVTASLVSAQSETYTESDILNPDKGINMYDNLNANAGGDSVRVCDGYGCEGWIEDYYSTGELLHKGYYEEGQLKIFKNYYKNGKMERQFKSFDNVRSSLKTYYSNEVVRNDIIYKYGYQFKRDDYLNDDKHTLVYQEEYHKSSDYFLVKRSYYDSGKLKASFELINAKKKVFSDMAFYETGNKKLDGKHKYDDNLFDYVKIGKWTFFDSKGDTSKEQIYVDGELDKEKVF